MNGGKAWAYTGVALGATVSVAANIAHSYVRPDDAPQDWAPETGAVIGAAFWPLALAVSSEVLARNSWSGRRRILGIGGVVIVAAVAAVVSYLHLKGLLAHYGEPGLTATIGPLSVDGLMLTSTVALIGSDRSGEPAADDQASTEGDSQDATQTPAPAPVPSSSDSDGAPERAPVAPATPRRRLASVTPPAGAKASPADEERRLADLPGWRGKTPPADWRDHVSGAPRTQDRRLEGARQLRASGAGSGVASGVPDGVTDSSDEPEREATLA